MNYKRLMPSRAIRLKILRFADFIPDRFMIKLQYWIKTGRRLNLKNPKRFNEKLQWYKLYYRDPVMTKCSDKYQVREYVAAKGLKNILIPLYGAYDTVGEINFDQLPETFVFKTNNGSQTNIIINNKSQLNFLETKRTLNTWLTKRTAKAGREWPYYNIQPKVICEQLLNKDKNGNLLEYKFYCFDGKPHFIKVVKNNASDLENGIYNMDFEQLPYCRKDVSRITDNLPHPSNFKLMCEIAETLSKDFPHVRVDLYNIDGAIYFGELTFFDTSGYQVFEPDEFDFILGKLFSINKMIF